MDALFLDSSKAFDCVSHSKLLLEFNTILGNEQILTRLDNYFHNRSQFVQVEESRSDCIPICSGVPRRSVLRPLLFLLFINDLTNNNPLVNFSLFADDVVMFTEVKTMNDQVRMNTCLEYIIN